MGFCDSNGRGKGTLKGLGVAAAEKGNFERLDARVYIYYKLAK